MVVSREEGAITSEEIQFLPEKGAIVINSVPPGQTRFF